MDVFRLLGWKIRTFRLALELTQEELADLVGAIDQAYISELENGKGNPTLQIINAVAIALKVPIQELFSLEHVPVDILNAQPRKSRS